MRLKHLKVKKFIAGFLFTVLILLIFRGWFFYFVSLSSGDSPFLFKENIKEFPILPFLWGIRNLGNMSLFHWGSLYSGITNAASSFLSLSWPISVRIFWFWPFVVLSIFSSYYLTKSWLGSLIYTTNTYILITAGVGQKSILMAYSIAPLVLGLFINIINQFTGSRVKELKNSLIKNCLIVGLILSIQVMWDLRIAYITLIGTLLYYIINQFTGSRVKELKSWRVVRNVFFVFGIPFLVVLGLHFYWILPLLMTWRNGGTPLQNLGSAYTTTGAVKYLSWAKFEQTVSLLHPLWPESVYGKAGFMKPEFLIIPIIAFSSLLFVRMKADGKRILVNEQISLLFFALLALIGAFLAKGSNPPLGGVYLWLFKYFPGMIMFRDASKFYTLIALSYSVLIPFSISRIYEWLKKR